MSNIFPTISTGCFFFIFALSSFVMIGLSDSVGRSDDTQCGCEWVGQDLVSMCTGCGSFSRRFTRKGNESYKIKH